MRATSRLLVVSGLAAASLVACQLLVGITDDEGSPVSDEAGRDADGVDAAAAARADCGQRRPPAPPSDGGAGGPDLDLIFAFRTVTFVPRLGDGGEPQGVIGYDLDDRCTGIGTINNDPPCARPDTATAQDEVDKAGGVDNAFQSTFDDFPLDKRKPDPASAAFNKLIGQGKQTLLLVVRNYNGGPDDEEVKIALLSAPGLESPSDGGPMWDGGDRWTRPPLVTLFNGLPQTPLAGYVSNFTLVVGFTDLDIVFPPFGLPLKNGVLTARIVEDGGIRSLVDGTIAGRGAVDALIMATGPIEFAGKNVCADPVLFRLLGDAVCRRRDVPLNVKDDGVKARCDAVSVGIGFEANLAHLVDDAGSPAPSPCDAAATPVCAP